jgi:hypothetical protein
MRNGWIVLGVTLSGCVAPAPSADAAARSDVETGDVRVQPDAQVVDARDGDAMVMGCGRCARYAEPVFSGRRPNVINELSGLAASAVHPGIYWAHNDSGDSARLFAIGPDGAVVGEYAITGASAADWEDIAVAPCPVGGGSCIVIGDVGDNPSTRTSVDLYRVREPSMLQAMGSLEATRFRVRYPSGAMNCEAIVVDRADGRTALLIEKASSATLRVVTVDVSAAMGGAVMASEHGTIANFNGALVTGADMHPCDRSIIVRTYASAWELRGASGATLVDLSRAMRAEVPAAAEVQGEAIAYVHDGRGYITSSEGTTAVFRATSCAR